MSPNGFDHGQPSRDLSPDERLNLLIQQSQQMQREAIQAQLQVPPLPLADVAVHQGDQMPRETVGEWNPISSLAQGMVSSSGEGPPSVCHGKPLANMRTDEATQPTGHHSSHPSSSSQLPMITGQDSREFENLPIQVFASATRSSARISNFSNFEFSRFHGEFPTNDR